ncbi:MAG: MG2 domain-containing protein [Pirellulales bacterium]
MKLSPDLHQRLLEFVYDLLPAQESAELARRIEAEPEMAAALAQVRSDTARLAAAARLEAHPIELAQPAGGVQPSRRLPAVARHAAPPAPPAARGSRAVHWGLALAASLLLLLSMAGHWSDRFFTAGLDRDYKRLVVTGPARPRPGAPNIYSIRATSVLGKPLRAEVATRVYAPDGTELFTQVKRTDERGQARTLLPASLALATGSRLEIVAADGDQSQRVETRLVVELPRRRTYLSLDKPLYQPGETVYYRSLSLSQFGLEADQPQDAGLRMAFEIRDPAGAVVPGSQVEGVTDRGVGNGAFQLPPELPGGRYTLVARSLDQSFADQEREFFVREYRLPRLKKELEFTRDSYTPGDTVVADLAATQAEGPAASAAQLNIVASVDGQVVHQATAATDAAGRAQIEFALPETIERGDAQLSVIIDDGGAAETIAKTIPINLGRVAVSFYPEGGELVAGLENRVYFDARDPLGDPVHVEGHVVDDGGRKMAQLKTIHDGMGSFRLTPEAGRKYQLELTSPAGVTTNDSLPDPNDKAWLVLDTGDGVFEAAAPLELSLQAARTDRPIVVAAVCRGAQVAEQATVTERGIQRVSLPVDPRAAGVIRVTVYDYSGEAPLPVAERLVYRRPARRLQVDVQSPRERYSPGEAVELSFEVNDEDGQPAQAALGVSVVDDALLSLADDDSPAMTTHFFLTSEVDKPADLEDADFYLAHSPKAAQALDLLLGTQGWRRFVERQLDESIKSGQQAQVTRLAELGPVAPPAVFDNLPKLLPAYEAALSALANSRTQRLGTLLFFGSMGVLLATTLLSARGWIADGRLGVGVGVAAAASLLVAISHLRSPATIDTATPQIAFQSFKLEPAPVANDLYAKMEVNQDSWGRAWFERDQAWAYGMAGGLGNQPPVTPFQFGDDRQRNFFLFGTNREWPEWDGLNLGALGRELDVDYAVPLADRFDAGVRAMGGEMQGGMGLADAMPKLLYEQDEQGRFLVRQYAHQHAARSSPARSDFAETLYWNPLLLTDAAGRASIRFDLSDSVTSFAVRADAHGAGRLGSARHAIESRIPFSLEPKLPLEVTAGDRIDLPLSIANDTAGELDVQVELSSGGQSDAGELVKLLGPPASQVVLAPGKKQRHYFSLQAVAQAGEAIIEFRGAAAAQDGRPLADAVQRRLRIVPPGFPVHRSYGGRLSGEQQLSIDLPDDVVPGSLEVVLNAYPSTLADLQQGLESILNEPTGCFEQASTSNYPNILSLEYLEEHRVASPELTRRAKGLLASGYGKLTSYESPSKGYEWFGADPGHEALTAYGLMQFRDMEKVFDVDEQMIERTAAWLRSRRDGKGGYQQNPRALDSFGGAPKHITDAYITWALAESGQTDLAAELDHVDQLAETSRDPYLLSLAAAGLLAAGRHQSGRELLDKLAQAQADDGHLEGTDGSITRSGGLSLRVETTALAALAWLKLPDYGGQANRALEWIVANREAGGGFGSTQATILALKALVAHAKVHRAKITAGELVVRRDGELVGRQSFADGEQNTVRVSGIEAHLKAGMNHLAISLSGDNRMPYGLDVSYRARKLENHPDCPLRLTTRLARQRVKAGQTVAFSAELTNASDQGQPMTVAILGLPAGLEPRPAQLEELKKAGVFDYYETRAREVICYWRSLAPRRRVQIKLDLLAEVPGSYLGPASRTYLYYTAEQKQWADGLQVEVNR